MDVHAIGNELQFVNGGKFERVLDFTPNIMKLLQISQSNLLSLNIISLLSDGCFVCIYENLNIFSRLHNIGS